MTNVKAAACSYARVFLVASLAAYIASGDSPFTVSGEDLKTIVSAGAASLALTVVNALRPGDSRFGVGAPKPPADEYDATFDESLEPVDH